MRGRVSNFHHFSACLLIEWPLWMIINHLSNSLYSKSRELLKLYHVRGVMRKNRNYVCIHMIKFWLYVRKQYSLLQKVSWSRRSCQIIFFNPLWPNDWYISHECCPQILVQRLLTSYWKVSYWLFSTQLLNVICLSSQEVNVSMSKRSHPVSILKC